MYERRILKELDIWKSDPNRKPLILRGARQVGKTSIVNHFSKQYLQYIYLNLERSADADFFNAHKSMSELVPAIFFVKNKSWEHQSQTLLFIDEIQEVPEAINLLRYFYEEYPDIHVIAAGSLLETILTEKITMPVGRLMFKVLRPVCFEEFIGAMGESRLLEQYHTIPVSDYAHTTMLQFFNTYALIGGMPEIVKSYAANRNLTALKPIYESLIISYLNDTEKYAKNHSLVQVLRHVLKSMSAEAGTRIKFQHFGNSNYGSREVGEAMRNMERALIIQLVYPCTSPNLPLLPDLKKSPKLHLLDVGLMNYQAKIQKGVLNASTIEGAYTGKVAEQVAGQELLATSFSPLSQLQFWTRENKDATAEIDFIFVYEDLLIPIEVKAGVVGKLRSLHFYMDTAPHKYAVRVYSGKLSIQKVTTPKGKEYLLLNLPFYVLGKIQEYLEWMIETS